MPRLQFPAESEASHGLTVSSWIRRWVEREVDRRLSARNETLLLVHVPVRIELEKPSSVTANELGRRPNRLKRHPGE